ncbi:sulfide-dependent adenosine diphosphate thiazole synthase [bacterium]|nr:sulfide-dependent adenosine diphosphate thiazole synthase [bacterium]
MEQIVSHGIVNAYFSKLQNNLNVDCAIVGGGPSGLVAATYLSRAGYRVIILERHLAPGGGMWGGAMLFNNIVVQNEAVPLLDEFGIKYESIEGDCVITDSVHATSALIYHATREGTVIFNGISVEDVVFLNNRVSGVVINWSALHRDNLPVDPLVISASTVLEGTGHPCEVAQTVAAKNDIKLNTPTGKVMGERSLAVEEGERTTIENTKEIFPGLFVCGMAANGVSGSFRMGPIFGGMLLSGQKAAHLIKDTLTNG